MTRTDDQSPALRAVRALQDSPALDPVVERVRPVVTQLLERRPRLAALLHGRPLGHALHPLMTDAPIALWSSAVVLDLTGGASARPHADRLLGLGVLAALPTSLTGLADWSASGRRTQRVGAAHAVLNSAALALYATSWVLRRRGSRGAGVAASLAATGAVGVSGYLGGHMTSRLGAPPRGLSGPPTTRPTPDGDEVEVGANPEDGGVTTA
ncbi:DUF2231 domain-containing protein [Cellulomonas dongxiuzhuiae]|uniref:DUF2231 domain-containing protein n=1 Tax=Cellulomonas dongxiuzhuiae TaxID=2819979 RepID=A0ABX8GES0_9CELL|nr:DUF2231 domain-containing protein [Cellulomonas dongxiuzhuiae]MBO3093487.1 DUF2231 domain-containing protein [Cellulomonas dongxiuzhuiae]QWC14622.1 DUF2231 domain-containing protein [Cellulomonas dongxiuzhuiae]